MYEQFYKLRELPFALTPDPAFLFRTPQHGFALDMLRYGVMSGSGFCLLTGEVGCGKTLVVRELLESMADDVSIGLLNNLTSQSGRLLQWVNLAFGLDHTAPDEVTLYRRFERFLVDNYAEGKRAVLVVDEAQNLAPDMLEQLRVLSNVNSGKHVVLQTFLVGQPELLNTLRSPELRQFAQRINIEYRIGPLNPKDTLAYVRHRLTVAGGDPELFAVGAVAAAFQASRGVPRLINQLCDTALVYGYAEQQERIDKELMDEVIRGRRAGKIFPGKLARREPARRTRGPTEAKPASTG
ncbi:MAG: AAA family ATPase [Nevskiaceae bacterium]|jgi:type II secretory pathway predicted ATPase ExeA|nr:AAA family ATPase [Nevskiaceae bacterium]